MFLKPTKEYLKQRKIKTIIICYLENNNKTIIWEMAKAKRNSYLWIKQHLSSRFRKGILKHIWGKLKVNQKDTFKQTETKNWYVSLRNGFWVGAERFRSGENQESQANRKLAAHLECLHLYLVIYYLVDIYSVCLVYTHKSIYNKKHGKFK